jgi:hypothetical protein
MLALFLQWVRRARTLSVMGAQHCRRIENTYTISSFQRNRVSPLRPEKLLQRLSDKEEPDQTVCPITRSLQGRGGEITIRPKPLDNVPTLVKSGTATARKRCICEHNAEMGLGLVVWSEYTNARKRRYPERA